MPFTPYHFGPSGLVALTFRKSIDAPTFILANVIVDIEVLLAGAPPYHPYWHTLLIGTAVGALWGLVAYHLRSLFKRMMELLRLQYETNLPKTVLSGIAGTWLHIIVDSIYHPDVHPLWPTNLTGLFGLLTKTQTKILCLASWLMAIGLYLAILAALTRRTHHHTR